MIAIYAEKPDMGTKIAAALFGIPLENGVVVTFSQLEKYERQIKAQRTKNGYFKIRYQGQEAYVTWGYGHMCTLKELPDIDIRYQNWKNIPLPYIPDHYELKLLGNNTKQYNVIKNIFNKANHIICATDSDREGDLIMDYLYRYMQCKTPYSRAIFYEQSQESFQKAFLPENLVSSTGRLSVIESGRARSTGDFIVGMNLTVACTLKYPNNGVLSIGRVQTAVLNMIVQRENEIHNFKPTPYFVLQGKFATQKGIQYIGTHVSQKIPNAQEAHKLLSKLQNGSHVGVIFNLNTEQIKKKKPYLYDLSTLQMDANKKYGFSLSKTLSLAQKLYENTIITDLDTAAKLYGNTVETATYEDATFFAKGDQNIDSLIAKIQKLDINWTLYDLVKSSSNYPALQESILGMYRVANRMFIGSLIFTSLLLTLLLILWLNARRREVGIFLALGLKKTQVAGQFLMELLMIALPAFLLSYGLASFFAEKVGKTVLSNVTEGINKQMTKESLAANLGGGAEAESFSKTLTQIHMTVQPKQLLVVILVGGFILSLVSLISSRWLLHKKPKDLLVDVE